MASGPSRTNTFLKALQHHWKGFIYMRTSMDSEGTRQSHVVNREQRSAERAFRSSWGSLFYHADHGMTSNNQAAVPQVHSDKHRFGGTLPRDPTWPRPLVRMRGTLLRSWTGFSLARRSLLIYPRRAGSSRRRGILRKLGTQTR